MPVIAKRKPSRMQMGLVAVILSLLLGMGFLLLRPPSAEVVCRRTITALEFRDARTLIALADPTELAELNISQEKVQGLLSDVLGKQDFRGPYQFEREERPDPDIVQYAVKAGTTPFRDQSTLYVLVIDHPQKGWRLNLSNLLNLLCRKADLKGDITLLRNMNIKYQFWGVRDVEGGYHFNKLHPTMPERTKAEQWN
jgi:hypothetical protein